MTELQAIAVASGSATTSIVSADGNTTVSIRESRQLDEFAAELRRRVDVPVTLYGGMPPGPPTDGTILVCRPDVLQALLATHGREPAVCARVLPPLALVAFTLLGLFTMNALAAGRPGYPRLSASRKSLSAATTTAPSVSGQGSFFRSI